MRKAFNRTILSLVISCTLMIGIVSNAQAMATKPPPPAGYTLEEKMTALKGLAAMIQQLPMEDILAILLDSDCSINWNTGMIELVLYGDIAGIPLEGITIAIGISFNIFDPGMILIAGMDMFSIPGDVIGTPGADIMIDGDVSVFIPMKLQNIIDFIKYFYLSMELNTDSMSINIMGMEVVIGMKDIVLTMDMVQMGLVPFTYDEVECTGLTGGPSSGEININILTGDTYIPFSQCMLNQINELIGSMM